MSYRILYDRTFGCKFGAFLGTRGSITKSGKKTVLIDSSQDDDYAYTRYLDVPTARYFANYILFVCEQLEKESQKVPTKPIPAEQILLKPKKLHDTLRELCAYMNELMLDIRAYEQQNCQKDEDDE